MDNNNMLKLCRLCLVKDDVNIPIFEEQGDIRQIFLKISSCLPVKVSRDDQLPKKICDGCSYKLDMLYEFWNTSANAEKQLLTWLGEAGMSSQMADGTISAVAQQIKPADAFVKQETIDPPDIHMDDDDDDDEEDKDYMKQEDNSNNVEEPPPKRARRTAAVKAAIALDQNSDDDDDSGEPMTKVEDDSEDSDNEDHEPAFVDVPSTSADDQPGPSGVGKDGVEAPELAHVKVELLEDEVTNLHSCDECGKIFISRKKLKKHQISHSENRPHSCTICKKTFRRKYEVTSHMNTHNGNTYNCEICSKVMKSKGSLKIHMKRHLKEFIAKCEICGQGFVTNQEYQFHIGSKHGNATYICYICGRSCYDKATLQGHVQSHKSDYGSNPNIKCDVCQKTFLRDRYLRQHYQRVHKDGGQTFVCDHCGKKVNSKRSLRDHLLIHQGLKPIKCKECGKGFALRTTLKLHMRTHTGQKPYECPDCGKSFTQRTPLTIHMRYHSGERPYNCTICNTGFVSKGALTIHQKNRHRTA
ncbi:zinc finger protein OZF-like isoform X39 [Diorhabda carinulata]|uniref:zinc finger protein OZF-like isoform X39 n=1 Tax=Diorhabda carinulata TaxID=1163345 RepID=UPI0025A1F426|nr:zinc finger protein OZF-like isoform X39 [Diorhabda carinulata]